MSSGPRPALSQEEEAAFLSWAQAHQQGFIPEEARFAEQMRDEQEAHLLAEQIAQEEEMARKRSEAEREQLAILEATNPPTRMQPLRRLTQQDAAPPRSHNHGEFDSFGGLLAPPAIAEEGYSDEERQQHRRKQRRRSKSPGKGGGVANRGWLVAQHQIAAQNAFLLGRLLAIGHGSPSYYDAPYGQKAQNEGSYAAPSNSVSSTIVRDRQRILKQNAEYKRRRENQRIERENALIQARLRSTTHSRLVDPRRHAAEYAAHQAYRDLRSHFRNGGGGRRGQDARRDQAEAEEEHDENDGNGDGAEYDGEQEEGGNFDNAESAQYHMEEWQLQQYERQQQLLQQQHLRPSANASAANSRLSSAKSGVGGSSAAGSRSGSASASAWPGDGRARYSARNPAVMYASFTGSGALPPTSPSPSTEEARLRTQQILRKAREEAAALRGETLPPDPDLPSYDTTVEEKEQLDHQQQQQQHQQGQRQRHRQGGVSFDDSSVRRPRSGAATSAMSRSLGGSASQGALALLSGHGPRVGGPIRAAGGHAHALTPQAIQQLMEEVFLGAPTATDNNASAAPVASSGKQKHRSPRRSNAKAPPRHLSPLASTPTVPPPDAVPTIAETLAGVVSTSSSSSSQLLPALASAPESASAKKESKSKKAKATTAVAAKPVVAAASKPTRRPGRAAAAATAKPAEDATDADAGVVGGGGSEESELSSSTVASASNPPSSSSTTLPLPWLSTFAGISPGDLRDDDPEEIVDPAIEVPDGLDANRSVTTPLTLKALRSFMKPVNASKKVFFAE
jgi:hypothetical protein